MSLRVVNFLIGFLIGYALVRSTSLFEFLWNLIKAVLELGIRR